MPTREQMLRGIIRMNNEEVNYESATARDPSEVPGATSRRDDQPAVEPRTSKGPEANAVSPPQESVWEYAKRREREISRTVEEILDRDERLKVERATLREELVKLGQELDLLKPLIQEIPNGSECDTGSTSATDESAGGVQEDTPSRGNRRRRGVRGARHRWPPTGLEASPPGSPGEEE